MQISRFFLINLAKPVKTLLAVSILAAACMLVGVFTNGIISVYAFMAGGLCCSVMWPCIFSLSVGGLGKYTSQGSSLLVMAILGGAFVPLIQGALADSDFGVQKSFIVPVFCYLYILFFGLYCAKNLKNVEHASGVSGH